ncbi:carbohydrate ABC transporter permease [Bacteroidetes/Chlorobi group bacterium Naka2016]|jgi:multiple sugar transport system permease protein|nr:MAG: carbohydrate ABC transporter permease [Bacteroidetes/Chlorobi group bacterium Naka2016]
MAYYYDFVKKFPTYLFLILLTIIMLFPMFWMFLLALKEFPERFSSFYELLTAKFTLKNYYEAFKSDSFLIYFINSFVVALLVTIGNLFFCFLVAYALERKKYLINKIVFLTVLGIMIIPQHIVMIPLFRLIVNFEWMNTYYALVVPWLVTPFGIFMVKQYIQQIPVEIEDAAKIDGCSDWKVIFKIVLPLSKPIFTVLGIYVFLLNWNSFLFPFIFTNEETMRTLPVGLAFYLGKQSIDWGHLMAGASFSALPVILLFLFFRKQIISGLIQGALKE